jgi:hypothetical protein
VIHPVRALLILVTTSVVAGVGSTAWAQQAPEDERSWHALAMSRYLAGDLDGALRAWNQTDSPRLESIEVHGARRTRKSVVADLVGIRAEQLLTPESFLRASRRLEMLPISNDARMRYEPTGNGQARIDVYLDEADVIPQSVVALAVLGTNALVFQELVFQTAAPTGRGEVWTAAWRWSENWRRLRAGVDIPAPGALPGVLSIRTFWERHAFGTASDVIISREERTHADLALSDWATGWLAWQAGGGFDRFNQRDYLSLDGSIEARLAEDHMALDVGGTAWSPTARGASFATGRAMWSVRTTTKPRLPVLTTSVGVIVAGRDAPFAVWPGAGSDVISDAPLRAHRLSDKSVVNGPAFGRRFVFGTIEYERPVGRSAAGPLSIAGFVDAVRAGDRAGGLAASPVYIDVGLGLRIHAPGVAGVVRVDVARGIRDGRTRVSAGLMQRWPRRWGG